jgi:integrase/recombinase XerD
MSLSMWVEFFEDLEQVRGRSKNTVLAYRRDLDLYDEFKGKFPQASINSFYSFIEKKGLSTRSQARAISSLRTYFKFCESNGKTAPELRELRPPKVKVGLPNPITTEEFQKLYDACRHDDPFKQGRNQITLLLLYGLGCRVSELISLNLEHFQDDMSVVKLLGKGGKERLIPVSSELQKELKAYVNAVRPNLTKSEAKALLINDRGKRPSRVDIWRWLSTWSQGAGFTEPIHPHRFRHGCATALLDSGMDLRSIQMLLGHASLQTTQIYTSVSQKKMADSVNEHHPLSQLKDN